MLFILLILLLRSILPIVTATPIGLGGGGGGGGVWTKLERSSAYSRRCAALRAEMNPGVRYGSYSNYHPSYGSYSF